MARATTESSVQPKEVLLFRERTVHREVELAGRLTRKFVIMVEEKMREHGLKERVAGKIKASEVG